MKKTYLLNNKLIRLPDKHKLRSAKLAQRIGSTPFAIYDLKSKKQGLGEERLLKILAKDLRLPDSEIRKIFQTAINEKYLGSYQK